MGPTTYCQQLIQSIFVICICQSGIAIRHKFFFDNEDLFAPCDDVPPEAGDIHDVFDFANLTMSYEDGNIHVTGSMTCVWKGLSPDDRIEARVQVYKFARGKWQPTVLSAYIFDFCADMFLKGSLSNDVWAQYILKEDRKCFSNYGHIYHHQPFNVELIYNFNINMEGRYNNILTFVAVAKDGTSRPNYICASFQGEYVKIGW
ncbi:uncharacterized protein LOC142239103 [Haematobia irritans]|uniref:uncharacterized protein LOC142239103 n=1 Tax=Haematobia irritans TaxID=7368 RepID=UPI003F503C05